jgi:hypothetical protein
MNTQSRQGVQPPAVSQTGQRLPNREGFLTPASLKTQRRQDRHGRTSALRPFPPFASSRGTLWPQSQEDDSKMHSWWPQPRCGCFRRRDQTQGYPRSSANPSMRWGSQRRWRRQGRIPAA